MAGMGVVLFVSHFKVRDTNTDAIAENALLYALAHAATLRRRASESVRVVEIRPTIRGSGTFVYQFSQTVCTQTETKRTKHLLSNNKMPAPSPLVIATSVLTRYVKEEKSYHQELDQQSARIAKLEAGEDADNENADFILRQQVSFL
jgi:hypothetical protein